MKKLKSIGFALLYLVIPILLQLIVGFEIQIQIILMQWRGKEISFNALEQMLSNYGFNLILISMINLDLISGMGSWYYFIRKRRDVSPVDYRKILSPKTVGCLAALAFFAQLYDDAPKEQASETVSISENEIYFKRQPLTEEQKKHGSYVDENGNLHVKNLSAFWIPELTTTEKVGHTTYTVTGSYEGKESFLKKLERIVAKNAQQKFEDEGADE